MNVDRAEATNGDLDKVVRLLRATDLPTADIQSARATFYLGRVDGQSVAVGGIENCGSVCLLRSVAVPEAERGAGYGTAIVTDLLERARGRFEACYLLTTTATAFFEKQGFEPIKRDAVPEAIRETAQFDDLCPTSATVMWRALH